MGSSASVQLDQEGQSLLQLIRSQHKKDPTRIRTILTHIYAGWEAEEKRKETNRNKK